MLRSMLVVALLAAPGAVPAAHPGATVVPGPATVSPTVQSGPTSVVRRVQDTYVSNTGATDHSQGAFLHVGTPDGGTTRYRSFLQFEVSRLAGATIESAKLRLYNSYTGSCDGWWMYADPVASSWNQSTITWANQPGVNTAAGAGASAAFGIGNASGCPDHPDFTDPDASDGLYRLDVTKMVTGWVTGSLPNYGIRLYAGESDTKAYKDFCAMNPGAASTTDPCTIAYNTPTLEVTFNTGHPVVAVTDSSTKSVEFYDGADPSAWRSKGPITTWAADPYHSITDTALQPNGPWDGGVDARLRPAGHYGSGQVLVTADGNGFVGVIPYPALSGRKWAINVGVAGNIHGAELLPDGNVAVALSKTGRLQLYSAAQGQDWAHASHTPLADLPLTDVHQVLYDPEPASLWAIGATELVRYPYSGGTFGEPVRYPLPPQTTFTATTPAYGHDISFVRGDPDRLWVSANGGVTQFSKSGTATCAVTSTATKWPDPASPGVGTRWCGDFPHVQQINANRMAKCAGDDPATGKVLWTWPAPATGAPEWTTPSVTFVSSAGQVSGSGSATRQYYRARWLVPSYG
jgi:hypothetical protein